MQPFSILHKPLNYNILTPLYIIILNYNSWKDTIECIEALLNSEFQDFQIILLDNNSPNNSESKILEYFHGNIRPDISHPFFKNKLKIRSSGLPYIYFSIEDKLPNLNDIDEKAVVNKATTIIHNPILFIQTEKNLGFAGGNNVALKILLESKLDDLTKVFLLNPDTFIESHALQKLSDFKEDFFISSCTIKSYDTPEEAGFSGSFRLKKPFGIIENLKDSGDIDYIYGGALLTNLKTIRMIGIMPDNYFLYWEETDWCFNAKLQNVKLEVCKEAVVYDKVGTSTGRGYLANYYFIRNGLIFYKKYLKTYMPSLLLYIGLRILDKVRKGELNSAKAMIHGAKDYFKGKEGFTPIS